MTEDSSPSVRSAIAAKVGLVWFGRALALLLVALSLIVAALRLPGAASSVSYLASRATVFDVWSALNLLELVGLLVAIGGAGFFLLRQKLVAALLFSLLAWPIGVVIEGGRCDTPSACRTMGWAALPVGAYDWRTRIRPVTDEHEAEAIASGALFEAGSEHHAYIARRFDDHWMVATIDDDGWPGPHAVKIDARSGESSFVPCPAHLMRCGMERPAISEPGQIFSNGRWGLAVTFPPGRSVCAARPADDPRGSDAQGFYAMIRDPDEPCDIYDPSRTLGLEAMEASTVAEALPKTCRPLSPGVLAAFGGTAPGFAGRRSVVCEEVGQGQIAVGVYATAEVTPAQGGLSRTVFGAWMLTDPTHLAEDARSFEAFLETARIGVPAS